MRIPLIAGNWKMFKTVHETIVFAKELRSVLKDVTGVEIVVAPPFTSVYAAAEALRNSNIAVAAQDVYWEREGAFTGEVAAPMIKDAGAEFVIIGHSERRRLFGETDAMVNRKVIAAIAAELTPIVCVGETLEERERNETLQVLDRQLKDGLDRVTGAQVADLVVAYEPVWAIGTGRNATAAQAEEAHQHIRQRLKQWFGGDAAAACHVIYGGSVKPDNIAQLIAEPDVDGALVGGASLEIGSFAGHRDPEPGGCGIISVSRNAHAVLPGHGSLCVRLLRPADGDPAPAGQGRRHGKRVRRRQQPDRVRRARRRDAALEDHGGVRRAVHARRARPGDHRRAQRQRHAPARHARTCGSGASARGAGGVVPRTGDARIDSSGADGSGHAARGTAGGSGTGRTTQASRVKHVIRNLELGIWNAHTRIPNS